MDDAGLWRRVVEPVATPVSVDEAKSHLRVEVADDDALIQAYLEAATQWCEEFMSRALMPQTWEVHLARWPGGRKLTLPRPPVVSVSWVKAFDEAGAETLMDPAGYVVDTVSEPGAVTLLSTASWPAPAAALRPVSGVMVRYVCGYADDEAVPAAIRQAIKFLTGHYYENRESVVVGNVQAVQTPEAVRALLWPWRVW